MLCDGVGGESSREDVSGVFPGQAEAVCLHFQCNGKVAELGPFPKGHSNLKRNGPMLILRL